MFKMIIGADLVPWKTNYDLFEEGNVQKLIGKELEKELFNADFRVFNLETPVCTHKDPIYKCGANFITPPETLKGVKALCPSLLTLANNHIMDQGEQGLFATVDNLKQYDIPYMGVGKNLDDAKKPYIIKADGKKIGILNVAEHEFSIATDTKAGANPFDPLESPDDAFELKAECDFVVVLFHGGKEHYRYPSPNLQKICRKLADKGADLVVCQHSHCIGCKEEYKDSLIVYGQGNFHFDHSEMETTFTSLVIEASFDDKMHVRFIPIQKDGNVIKMADEEAAKEIMEGFETRSGEIKESGFIQKKYNEFSVGWNKWYRYMFAGGEKQHSYEDFIKIEYDLTALLAIKNYCDCEAHAELFEAGIDLLIEDAIKKEKGGK